MENKLELGDIIIMKKDHACGGKEWVITRVGADIKLKCLTCNHEIMLDRVEFNKRFKKKVGGTNEKN